MGKPIVMGRRTYDSIGRPLPGRQNIVISRQSDYIADGCDVVTSAAAAVAAAAGADEIMIIGGSQIYAAFLPEAQRIYGDRNDLVLCESALDALVGADALAIVTEWREFRSPDFDAIKTRLGSPLIVDGRNLYDPDTLKSLGFTYYAIGRGESVRVV